MTGRLAEKVALITGAGSGIGRETTLLFCSEGASVVAADIDEGAAMETVEMARGAGGTAASHRADVSSAIDCEEMVASAESLYGRLDILFNNAGIAHPEDDDAISTEEDTWDLTMEVNVKGVFLGCKYGIPALRRAGG